MRNKSLEKKAIAIVNRHIKEQEKSLETIKLGDEIFGNKTKIVTVSKKRAIQIEYNRLVLNKKYYKWRQAHGKYEASIIDGIKHIKMSRNDWKLHREWDEGMFKKYLNEMNKIGSYIKVKIS